ncbi:hypothetical protein [Flavobacterium sp. SM2513]|uniref:hypothetical protein n=1 Tax=Flavobacterium sp. SM2513 TaxID=3424766 RepID=UPI003D7F48DE
MKKLPLFNFRFVLFAIVLLFSLTPCKVKASWFETFGGTYEQTLNQSKTTSNCNAASFRIEKVSKMQVVAAVIPNFTDVQLTLLGKEKVIESQFFTKVILLQLPPKYLLYKQFKFDLV